MGNLVKTYCFMKINKINKLMLNSFDILNQYEGWAHGYELDMRHMRYIAHVLLIDEVKKIVANDNPIVVEAGIGTGLSAKKIKATFHNATIDGLDFSPEMLAIAKAKKVARKLTQTNLEQAWPTENQYADIVFSIGTMEHITDQAFFTTEATRTLKPGGYFAATYMMENEYGSTNIGSDRNVIRATSYHDFETFCKNSELTIISHFKAAGFGGGILDLAPEYGYLIAQKPLAPTQQ